MRPRGETLSKKKLRFNSDYSERVELDDGQAVTLRLVRPTDKQLLLQGFERLSPASRHFRFMGVRNTFSEADLRYLCEVDGMDQSHNLLGTSGKDREIFPMAFEGGCWFVRNNRFRLHEDGRFYEVPVGDTESRYSMEILDPGLFREARVELHKQLETFMEIKKVDDSYKIVPFGVEGDNFKTRQLGKNLP